MMVYIIDLLGNEPNGNTDGPDDVERPRRSAVGEIMDRSVEGGCPTESMGKSLGREASASSFSSRQQSVVCRGRSRPQNGGDAVSTDWPPMLAAP